MEESKNQEIKKPRLPLYTVPDALSEQIIADYKSGMMKKDIAKKYNLSGYYITVCLKNKNVPLNDRSRCNKEPEWKKTATEMYYNGATLAKISEKVGMHARTLSVYFKNSGATDEKKRRQIESFQPVIDDFVSGMKQLELEEKYPQFSKNNIKHIINKFCPKRKEEISADEEEVIIAMLPKAEVKAKVRVTKEIVNKKVHVYQDIFDLIAGV